MPIMVSPSALVTDDEGAPERPVPPPPPARFDVVVW
jgi:hypothetical protein